MVHHYGLLSTLLRSLATRKAPFPAKAGMTELMGVSVATAA
jgi:hypothetical protein